jgi:hypothetical protein
LLCSAGSKNLKLSFFTVSLFGIVFLFLLMGNDRPDTDLAHAQAIKQDGTKDSPEQKQPSSGFGSPEQKQSSPGFEDDQSAMCQSATRQAKLIASVVETYSRRLAGCATSNPNFRDDCSMDFRRLANGYSQYQLAVASVRNYCR